MRFLTRLDPVQIAQAQQDSQAFWGGGLAFAERLANVRRLMADAGPAYLHMEGLVDAAGNVVASMKRYSFLLAIPGQPSPVRAIGIGSVFTAEPHRHHGHASLMLRQVLEAARGEGFGAAILYSDIAPALYERLGFRSIPAWDWWADAASLPDSDPLAVREATPSDRPRLLHWHAQAWPTDWLRVVREPASWDLQWAINGRPRFCILSDAGRDVGYLAMSDTKAGGLWIDEWCVPAAERPVMAPRVMAAVRRLARADARVGAWLRPDDWRLGFAPTPRLRAVPMLAGLLPAIQIDLTAPERAHFGSMDHV